MPPGNPEEPAIVVTKAYDLVLWLLPKAETFSRSYRFSVGERVVAHSLDLLLALVEAAYTGQQSGPAATGQHQGERAALPAAPGQGPAANHQPLTTSHGTEGAPRWVAGRSRWRGDREARGRSLAAVDLLSQPAAGGAARGGGQAHSPGRGRVCAGFGAAVGYTPAGVAGWVVHAWPVPLLPHTRSQAAPDFGSAFPRPGGTSRVDPSAGAGLRRWGRPPGLRGSSRTRSGAVPARAAAATC